MKVREKGEKLIGWCRELNTFLRRIAILFLTKVFDKNCQFCAE
jgi:hypothetical protein